MKKRFLPITVTVIMILFIVTRAAADSEPVNFSSTGTNSCSVTIDQNLTFTIANAIYDAGPSVGQMALKIDFQFFGEQNGKLLWQLGDVDTTPSSTSCPVSIAPDLSFTLTDAIYDAGPLVGQTTLQADFEHFGEKNGSFLWSLADLKIYGYPGYWVSPFDKGTGAFIQTYQNHSKEYLTGQNQYSIENYKGQKGVWPDDYWEILTTPQHVLGMDFSWDDWGVSIYAVQGGEITDITLEDNSVNGVHFFIVDKTKQDGWYGADYGHIDVYSMFDNGLISQEKLNLILNGEVVDGPLVFQGQLLGSTGDSCCQVGILHISTAYEGFSNGEKNIDPMTLWTKEERPDFCDCRPIKYGIPGY